MNKILVSFLLWIFVGGAKAEIVISCDGKYSAKVGDHGSMVIKRSKRIVGSIPLDHAIDGGTFSLDNSYVVVFGLPNEAHVRYAQATQLSLYSVRPRISLVKKSVYGGGVYSAAFDGSQRFIVVENQFGVDVINIKRKSTRSFDAAYVPQFRMQRCERK
ncbi:hypothetical protein [Caballeronia sp. ATUFL_M2_KS44]|uniref:hypothetical protein n=1 Tax=Caballeronia sp. ATUFL_M2_KS44 TaxID=2921767 RepID=UPI002027C242|nr:hypothetical protein [Caballeronia sp. ATUFL_M2_KS44]